MITLKKTFQLAGLLYFIHAASLKLRRKNSLTCFDFSFSIFFDCRLLNNSIWFYIAIQCVYVYPLEKGKVLLQFCISTLTEIPVKHSHCKRRTVNLNWLELLFSFKPPDKTQRKHLSTNILGEIESHCSLYPVFFSVCIAVIQLHSSTRPSYFLSSTNII